MCEVSFMDSQNPHFALKGLADARYGDAMRRLRALLGARLEPLKNIILVTSSWPNEGKTTTCLNLAATFAEGGRKVLIVDGDLRQQTSSRLAPVELEGGLASLLNDGEVAVHAIAPELWLAPGGRLADPSVLLVSQAFNLWLERQRHAFDLVFVDSPPLSVCKDALILSQYCDGTLVVASKSRFRGLDEGHYCEDLREQGAKIIGVVSTP